MDIARPDLKQRKNRTRLIVIGGCAAAFLAATGAALTLGNASPSVRRADVLIDTVQQGDFVRSVRGAGKLVPSQSRWSVARTDARVERILQHPGSEVTADTVILELSNPQVEGEALAALAEYSAAESDHTALEARLQNELLTLRSELAAIRGEYETAKVQEAASRRAFEKGVLAEVEHQRIFISMTQLRNRLAIAEERVERFRSGMQAQMGASTSRMEQMRNMRDLRAAEAEALNVKAGLAGTLQEVIVEEGQQVASGHSLARIVRAEGLLAELHVPESQAAQLTAGQQAVVQVGRTPVEGTVRRVNPAIQDGSVRVEVELGDALPSGARPEQSVDGSIILGELADTMHVGRPANLMPNASNLVYRLVGRDTAVRTEVTFGVDSLTRVQVVNGLSEGDRIILSDLSQIGDADRVTLD